MSWWCLLVLLSLPNPTVSTNPGVKVHINQQVLDYGLQTGIAYLQEKLRSVKIHDIFGHEDLFPIGNFNYRLSGMRITDLGLPQSSLGLVPGTGISLSIGNAFISLHGDWRVTYLGFMQDSGCFDVAVFHLTIKAAIGVGSDETGRPTVSSYGCTTSVDGVSVTLNGGASWFYNLFTSFIDQALHNSLQTQICPLMQTDLLKTLNEYLQQGFPLPAVGRMNLINSKLQFQKDYVVIETDVHFRR